MKSLNRDEFLNCLNGIRLSWDHAELRDSYGVPADLEQVERWRRGEGTHPAYYADFVPMVENLTRRGCQLRRVKVVCEPLNDYHRWVHSMVPPIIRAGEATRWLPRIRLEGHLIPATDFYVLDDNKLVYLFFDGNGRVVKRILIEDRAEVEVVADLFADFWARSYEHDEYRPG